MQQTVIAQHRLANQCLLQPIFTKPSEVVRHLGAIQAQDYAGAKWAVAQRAKGLTDCSLEEALAAGTILRTHVLRPTWHFVSPADIRWMLKLTAPRVNATNSYQYRVCELDAALFKRSNALLVKALRDGQQLTRAELATLFARHGIETDALRMAHLMMRAELDAVVCSGARRGKQFTHALLDERVPGTLSLTRDEALAELTRRYLGSRGPATAADFAWWSGLTMTDAKRGFASVKNEFQQASTGQHTFWFPASLTSKVNSTACLLPAFDEYLVGYKDRRPAIDNPHAQQLVGGAISSPTLMLNGQVVGIWKRVLQKKEVLLEMRFFLPLKKSQIQAFGRVSRQYGSFLGLPIKLQT